MATTTSLVQKGHSSIPGRERLSQPTRTPYFRLEVNKTHQILAPQKGGREWLPPFIVFSQEGFWGVWHAPENQMCMTLLENAPNPSPQYLCAMLTCYLPLLDLLGGAVNEHIQGPDHTGDSNDVECH
jgi:hypothetical protein